GPVRWTIGLGLSRNLSFVEGSAGLRGGEGDNFYVDLLGRTGILGTLLFLSMVGIVAAKVVTRFAATRPQALARNTFPLALIGSVMVYGLVESHLFTSGTLHAYVFMLLLVSARSTSPDYTNRHRSYHILGDV